ncbi:phosphohydrolase [Methanocella sp. CWC-04]|uniref:Phosphohydrolase n=1 Tax=Methanooceanicella nereidis TaxID=2052831 RepID=A0AAP2REF3_9EURY|nr:HD domain-containing protein [Methanocella sp. CWC-04]MCD1295281.1 phosphohydrolase [Methanocella sp. CWC-04]
MDERLKKQIDFIVEIDKLKNVFRQSYLINDSRKENSVEHSWHLALMVVILSEYADMKNIDILRAVKMSLIHDIVEIDAGDSFAYGETSWKEKIERERSAAKRLFNILPSDQAIELKILWEEFENMSTPEAKFAASLDRLQPLLQNYFTQGKTWREHGVTRDKVIKRNVPLKDFSAELWELAVFLIDDSVKKGYLNK